MRASAAITFKLHFQSAFSLAHHMKLVGTFSMAVVALMLTAEASHLGTASTVSRPRDAGKPSILGRIKNRLRGIKIQSSESSVPGLGKSLTAERPSQPMLNTPPSFKDWVEPAERELETDVGKTQTHTPVQKLELGEMTEDDDFLNYEIN